MSDVPVSTASSSTDNAYLWWDADSGMFTLVPWDMNLAFGGLGGGFGGDQPPERPAPGRRSAS